MGSQKQTTKFPSGGIRCPTRGSPPIAFTSSPTLSLNDLFARAYPEETTFELSEFYSIPTPISHTYTRAMCVRKLFNSKCAEVFYRPDERPPIIIIRPRATIGRAPRHVYSSSTVYTCGLTGYWRLVVTARVYAVTSALRFRVCVSAYA